MADRCAYKPGSLAAVDPYLALAAGVVANASKEAREGDLGAAEWLLSDFCDLFCDVVGLDFERIQRTATGWMDDPAGVLIVRLSL